MNLTTEFEVLKYSPAGFDYPTSMFCLLIPQYEQQLKRECLGDDLFDFLVSKLTPYPATVSEWDESISYSIGDVVIRNNCTFTSTANTNTTDPLVAGSDWTPFERFTHSGANNLWSLYLRQIMATKVFAGSLGSATYRAGSGGLVVNSGDGTGSRSATKTEMLTSMTQFNGFIEMTTVNMIEWLTDNYVAQDLPIPACVGNCDVPENRSRRFAWR